MREDEVCSYCCHQCCRCLLLGWAGATSSSSSSSSGVSGRPLKCHSCLAGGEEHGNPVRKRQLWQEKCSILKRSGTFSTALVQRRVRKSSVSDVCAAFERCTWRPDGGWGRPRQGEHTSSHTGPRGPARGGRCRLHRPRPAHNSGSSQTAWERLHLRFTASLSHCVRHAIQCTMFCG